jgi:hypothetical protein
MEANTTETAHEVVKANVRNSVELERGREVLPPGFEPGLEGILGGEIPASKALYP